MRFVFALCVVMLPLVARADKADPPGSSKLISDSPFLVDTQSGDTFSQISATDPVSFALTGPGKFQVDFRVNLKRKGSAKPVNLEIFAGGSLLTQLRINSRAARGGSWRKVTEFKPSESAGFYLSLDAGSQIVIFRIDEGATLGAAVNIVEASASQHPLAADAPVLQVPVDASPAGTTPSDSTTPVAKTEPAKTEPTRNDTAVAKTEPARTESTHEMRAKPATAEVHAKTAPPPVAPVEENKSHAVSLVVGGGFAVHSELNAFDSAGAAQAIAGVAIQLPMRLFLSLDYELRYGTVIIPVVGAGAESTPEIRHELSLAFGWAPVLAQSGDLTLSLPFSASYQLLIFSNQVAPAIAGLIGPDLGLRLSKAWFTVDASVGYGFRIHDSTPSADASGGINGRLRWQAEALGQVSGVLGVFVSYQGESLVRAQSTRIANAMLAGVTISFL